MELLYRAVRAHGGAGAPLDLSAQAARVTAAVEDDLNTPAAIDALRDLANALLAGARAGYNVDAVRRALRDAGFVLGLTTTR